MKSLLFFPFILLAMLLAWASKTFAQTNTETRNLEAFEAVKLTGSPDVFLTQGDSEKAIITTENADVKVITEVKNGVLQVYIEDVDKTKKAKYNRYGKVKLNITFRKINAVEVTGSGNIVVESPLKIDNFETGVKGSGDIKINNINVSNKLVVSVTGSGNLNINEGTANTIKVNVTGSGNVSMKKLMAKEANVNVSGSGNASICANEVLNANVGGSGNISYSGNPAKVNKNVSGSGNIRGK